jgi:hypothetical protein
VYLATRSKRTSGVPSSSLALKRSILSVFFGTITHVLAISDLQLDNTVVLDSRVTLGGSPEVEVTLV